MYNYLDDFDVMGLSGVKHKFSCPVICVCSRSFVLFLLVIVLSVLLPLTPVDYFFDIFKLFFEATVVVPV